MKNIEFKARCDDLDLIRRLLADKNIELDYRMHQIDTYFNVSLGRDRGRLKLREIVGERCELIQYQRSDLAQARESDYLVVPVENVDLIKEALQRSLGVWVIVDKVRELYLWEHTRVHLDQVKGLGYFIELETVISDQGKEDAQEECERIRQALAISTENLMALSYSDMVQPISELENAY
jgi:predicted adenylyl cyclase CyaB